MGAVMGVSITPGATAFTRTPLPTHLAAKFRVAATSPALAAE